MTETTGWHLLPNGGALHAGPDGIVIYGSDGTLAGHIVEGPPTAEQIAHAKHTLAMLALTGRGPR